MDVANQYCKNKAAQSGSSFYYSFLFLPPEQQQAIMAVYAFCREIDDIVDECTDKEIAYKKIEWWKGEVEDIFLNAPKHPVGRALTVAIDRFLLPKHLFEEILQGMLMDLSYQGYETFEDLRLYCHCVASSPGMIAAKIFGFEDLKTLEYAKNLGIAFQLVNIIRDVGEDATRGRVYLPEEELKQFSLTPENILNKEKSENFVALMKFQAKRARSYYEKALEILPEQDKSKQRTGIMMAEIYFTLLLEIEKTNFQVFHQRIALTPLRKFWIAWKTTRRLRKKN